MNRRQFLKKSTLTVALGVAAVYGLNSCSSITKIGSTAEIDPDTLMLNQNQLRVDISKEPQLSRIGGSVKIRNEKVPEGIIIARIDEHTLEIASLKCTHRGVEVEYNHKSQKFECASLGHSKYSLDGENLSGPAKHPLKNYSASMEGDILVINLSTV